MEQAINHIHTYMERVKMADSEQDEIENALNTIASSTERSTNMKKELKRFTQLSTLRKLLNLKKVWIAKPK